MSNYANIDLSQFFNNNTPEQPRKLIPDGVYKCELKSIKPAESKQGTPCLKCMFVVDDGEYADQAVWHDIYLTERNAKRVFKDLRKLQLVNEEQIKSYKGGNFYNVKVGNQTYNGNTTNEVQDINFVEHLEPKPDDDELAADALFRKLQGGE